MKRERSRGSWLCTAKILLRFLSDLRTPLRDLALSWFIRPSVASFGRATIPHSLPTRDPYFRRQLMTLAKHYFYRGRCFLPRFLSRGVTLLRKPWHGCHRDEVTGFSWCTTSKPAVNRMTTSQERLGFRLFVETNLLSTGFHGALLIFASLVLSAKKKKKKRRMCFALHRCDVRTKEMRVTRDRSGMRERW